MKFAIVSDIHANLQAWKAVLKDIKKQGCDSILCLGDVIGYGPKPAEVLDLAYEHCDYFILGNHDAVIGDRLDSDLFNDNAKKLIEWTRDQLSDDAADFFREMMLEMEGPDFTCAHGELAVPGRFGYIYEAQDTLESFQAMKHPLSFIGHTHHPALFRNDKLTGQISKQNPLDFTLAPDQQYIVNAGSVGDPRDGKLTASYVIYDCDKKKVQYRHIPFDIHAFERDLIRSGIDNSPLFLRIFEGQNDSTETLKDMRLDPKEMAAANVKSSGKGGFNINEAHPKRGKKKLAFNSAVATRAQSSMRAATAQGIPGVEAADGRGTNRRNVPPSQAKKSKMPLIVGAVVILLIAISLPFMLGGGGGKEKAKPIAKTNSPEDSRKTANTDSGLSGEGYKISEDGDTIELSFKGRSSEQNWTLPLTQESHWGIILSHQSLRPNTLRFSVNDEVFSFPVNAHLSTTQSIFIPIPIKPDADGKVKLAMSKAGSGSIEITKMLLKKSDATKIKDSKIRERELLFANFEFNTYEAAGWKTTGDAFGETPQLKGSATSSSVRGNEDYYFACGWKGTGTKVNVALTGSITSPKFLVAHDFLLMKMACFPKGEGHSTALIIDGTTHKLTPLHEFLPYKKHTLNQYCYDISEFVGKTAQLKILDRSDTALIVDDIRFSPTLKIAIPAQKITQLKQSKTIKNEKVGLIDGPSQDLQLKIDFNLPQFIIDNSADYKLVLHMFVATTSGADSSGLIECTLGEWLVAKQTISTADESWGAMPLNLPKLSELKGDFSLILGMNSTDGLDLGIKDNKPFLEVIRRTSPATTLPPRIKKAPSKKAKVEIIEGIAYFEVEGVVAYNYVSMSGPTINDVIAQPDKGDGIYRPFGLEGAGNPGTRLTQSWGSMMSFKQATFEVSSEYAARKGWKVLIATTKNNHIDSKKFEFTCQPQEKIHKIVIYQKGTERPSATKTIDKKTSSTTTKTIQEGVAFIPIKDTMSVLSVTLVKITKSSQIKSFGNQPFRAMSPSGNIISIRGYFPRITGREYSWQQGQNKVIVPMASLELQVLPENLPNGWGIRILGPNGVITEKLFPAGTKTNKVIIRRYTEAELEAAKAKQAAVAAAQKAEEDSGIITLKKEWASFAKLTVNADGPTKLFKSNITIRAYKGNTNLRGSPEAADSTIKHKWGKVVTADRVEVKFISSSIRTKTTSWTLTFYNEVGGVIGAKKMNKPTRKDFNFIFK